MTAKRMSVQSAENSGEGFFHIRHIKFGGKIRGKVQPSSPNKRKPWKVLSPQDAKVGKKPQFWGHT